MKLLLVPALLATVAVFQIIRIESVIADEPPAARKSAIPMSHQQMDFDRLAKEFENFARTDYVIEPPDIVSIRISYRLSEDEDSPRSYSNLLSNVATPRLRIAECMDAAPRRYVVGMDGFIRLSKITSVYIAGMTVKEAQDAIQRKLQPQAMKVDVWLSVAQFNSKVYYVITKGGQLGDDVTRLSIPFPVDGKENVAKALAQAYDDADRKLTPSELVSASLRLLRPAPNGGEQRVYPIIWDPSAQAPTPLTNHGILPGDRIFVELTPAAALPKKAGSVTDATGREFIIEPRFLPNVRGSRKSMPTGAEGDREEPSSLSSPQAEEAEPALRYGSFFDDAASSDNHPPATLSASLPDEKRSALDQEIAFKRIGDSNCLLAVRKSAADNVSGEPTEDSNVKLRVAPRWLETSRHRLQPFDTIRIRVARPHRPAHALTWGDIEGEFTVTHYGDVELSSGVGIVAVAGLNIDEARAAIERQLRKSMPDCEVQLALGTLAAEKYVISIQRPDGIEIAAGALRPGSLSEAEYFDFRCFVGDLVPIRTVKLERKFPSGDTESINPSTVWDVVQAPQMAAIEHPVRPGDRLIITVDQDWSSRRYPPVWLVPCDVAGERDYGQIRFRPGWRALYSTQFDHPDVQRPAGPKYSR